MEHGASYAVGHAVFIRTDTADYAEELVPFRDLEELTQVCSRSRLSSLLDRVEVYALLDGEPICLTLGFIAASKGQRPEVPAEALRE